MHSRPWRRALLFMAAACATGPDEDPNLVVSVDVQPAAHTLFLGVDPLVQLNATPRNRAAVALTGRSVAWRTGAATVATVSASGVVTAVGLGSAVITATVDGVEGSATVTVAPAPVATVTAALAAPVLIAGGATTATAVVRDAAGTTLTDRLLTWTSSNTAVATVSAMGEVAALGEGTTTLTASSESKSATAALCVVAAAPDFRVEQVTFSQAVQRPAGDIPLVSGGLPAAVSVWATTDRVLPAGCLRPRIRVTGFAAATEIFREEFEATGALPLAVDPFTPIGRAFLPSEAIAPGLRVLVEVDPLRAFPDPDTDDNAWPAPGAPGPVAVVPVPPLELRFVPIFLSNGGSLGMVTNASMDEYLYATRQMYPVSAIDWEIGDTFATNTVFGTGGQSAFSQMLGELDVKRVAEGSRRYYVGAVRPPPGVTSTQFGGIGYVPFNRASIGPGTRTNIVVGVGWFSRQRQTTELVAHELGHNHGRRHAPCGGAASPDAGYPHAGAQIGFTGIDMYTWSLAGGSPPLLGASSTFDVMSYCVPAWISDYTYQALITARQEAGPVAAGAARPGPSCDCLIVWGAVDEGGVTLQPAFVTRTRPQLPAAPGAYRVEGLREDGTTAFSWSFEPSEIDHAPDVRHFAFALPVARADRDALAAIRLTGSAGGATLTRAVASAGREVPRLAAAAQGSAMAVLSWPVGAWRAAVIRDPRTGQVLAISTTGTVTLPAPPAEVDVILSDGVRSETVRVRR